MNNHISALHSPNAEQRKQAIVALARAVKVTALPELERVAQGDTDSDIRELARKACVYIRKHAPATPILLKEPDFLAPILPATTAKAFVAEADNSRTDLYINLGIFALVEIIGTIILIVFTAHNIADWLVWLKLCVKDHNCSYWEGDVYVVGPLKILWSGTLSELILLGLALGIVGVVFSLYYNRLVHLTALFFRGRNTFFNLLHDTLSKQIVMNIISYVVLVPVLLTLRPTTQQMIDLSYIVRLVAGLIFIGLGIWLSWIISRTYRFGMIRGCATYLVATFFCSIVGFLIGLIL